MKFEQNWLSSLRSCLQVNGRTDKRTDDRQKVITTAHP